MIRVTLARPCSTLASLPTEARHVSVALGLTSPSMFSHRIRLPCTSVDCPFFAGLSTTDIPSDPFRLVKTLRRSVKANISTGSFRLNEYKGKVSILVLRMLGLYSISVSNRFLGFHGLMSTSRLFPYEAHHSWFFSRCIGRHHGLEREPHSTTSAACSESAGASSEFSLGVLTQLPVQYKCRYVTGKSRSE